MTKAPSKQSHKPAPPQRSPCIRPATLSDSEDTTD